MSRAVALNYFLGGALCSLLFTNACSGGQKSPFDAWAQEGPVEVVIVGQVTDPVPVMICDGQDRDGTCAQVFTNGLDRNALYTP